jgi:hypothetical protein
MSLEYIQNHAERFANILTYLRRNGYRAWETSTCGLHIHISKNSFADEKHQMKFIYFIYNNKKSMIKFAGRNSQFARFDLGSFLGEGSTYWEGEKPNLMEVVKGFRKNGKYVPSPNERNLAVNRMNNHTHELRIFRPSLRFKTVLAYFEFVHCLWAFTEQITSNEAIKNQALSTFEPFADYARINNTKYPNLVVWMHKRKCSEVPKGWLETNPEQEGN